MRRRWRFLALAATWLGWTGCGGSRGEADPLGDGALARLDLRARAAQMVVAPLGWPGAVADSAAEARLAGAVQRGEVGGVVVGGGEAAALVPRLRRLSAAAPLPLLVVAEVDGGLEVAEATDFPSAAALAALASAEEARAVGLRVGTEARAVGIHLGLVRQPPVNDTSALALLARDPARLARGLAAFVEGMGEAGVRGGVEALWSAQAGVPLLGWDRARLDAIEIPVLDAALGAGVSAVQLGAVRLPALTGDTLPLPHSPAAIRGLLRRDLGWGGLVVADLAPTSALVRAYGAGEAAVRAVAAGADLLVGPRDPAAIVAALVRAVREGRIPEERIAEAAGRILELKANLPDPAPRPDSALAILRDPAARALSLRLAAETTLLLPAPGAAATLPPDRPVVLATPLGRGEALAAALRAHLGGVDHLRLNLTADSAALAAALLQAVRSAGPVVLAAFPRAPGPGLLELAGGADGATEGPSPYRALFSPASLPAALGDGPAVVSWGTGPAAQLAAARLLLGEAAPPALPPALRWPPAPVLREAPPAEVGMDADALARVDRLLQDAVEEGEITGAALAVGRRGALVRLRGYGRTGPDSASAPVDPRETLFDLASLTKVIGTTSAAALLVEQERLRLDAPLHRYLPEFDGGGKDEVTFRHLLTHTSGLPSWLWLYGSARSPAEALRATLDQPLLREPGRRVEYSDLGMILLAEALERVAQTPIDRFLALHLFAPLGMSRTQYLPPMRLREQTVPTAAESERDLPLRGVVHDANAFRLGGVAGHAGLFSTARDVAVFAQTILNGGSYGTVRVLSPEIVRAFTTRQRGAETRALGWDTPSPRSSAGRYFSERSFGHTGFTGTSLWIDPERDLFVVLLTNRTYPETPSREILQLRAAVHDAVARAVTGAAVRPRPGSR